MEFINGAGAAAALSRAHRAVPRGLALVLLFAFADFKKFKRLKSFSSTLCINR